MIPAIPRRYMSDTAVYNSNIGSDGFGQPTKGADVTLENIFVRNTRNVYAKSLGEELRYDLVLYFDARTSTPSGQVFNDNDFITYGGKEYRVRTAEAFKDPTCNKVHHWEVKLYGN